MLFSSLDPRASDGAGCRSQEQASSQAMLLPTKTSEQALEREQCWLVCSWELVLGRAAGAGKQDHGSGLVRTLPLPTYLSGCFLRDELAQFASSRLLLPNFSERSRGNKLTKQNVSNDREDEGKILFLWPKS